jgi:hypothetical protein
MPTFKPQVFHFHYTDSLLDFSLFLELSVMITWLDVEFVAKPTNRPLLYLGLLKPYGLHLIPLSTGSLKPSLLVTLFNSEVTLAKTCDNPTHDNFVLSPKPLSLVIKR